MNVYDFLSRSGVVLNTEKFKMELFENNMIIKEDGNRSLITDIDNKFMITGNFSNVYKLCNDEKFQKILGFLLMTENKNHFFFIIDADNNDVMVGFKFDKIFSDYPSGMEPINIRFKVDLEWLDGVCDLEDKSNMIYVKTWTDEITAEQMRSIVDKMSIYDVAFDIFAKKLKVIELQDSINGSQG